MLHELRIRNFAIIDELALSFGPGLNILTGETGAGKSIIIDAIGLLLGDRAGAEMVRARTEIAAVEATFQLRGGNGVNGEADGEGAGSGVAAEVRQLLADEGLDDPDAPDWVTLAREVRLSGRSVARVNGRAVSVQIMADVASALIDIHGQGEHLNLLRPRTHVHLLDRYGELLSLRRQVAEQAGALRAVRDELQRLRQDARTIAQRLDLLSFQVEEIEAARLEPGEEAELESERRRLANAETLLKLAETAGKILSEGGGDVPSALDLVSEAVGRVEKLARVDPDMQPAAAEAQALLEQLSDLARTLEDYAERLEFNPARLQDVEERLELIANLKRKYGDTIAQINEYGRRARAELEGLANWEVRTVDLEQREDALLHAIGALGAELSAQRSAAGKRLAAGVEQELGDLKMARARFAVAVQQTERADGAFMPDGRRVAFDATGVDQVEFLVSANPGEPLKPMAKVASGGETARLMLGLKGVLSHADATPTLIFDEIDQGIGGRVGAVVGQKLWKLTKPRGHAGAGDEVAHQVLCITHLPQLAAFGDRHFSVAKHVQQADGGERTFTVVHALDGESRVQELTQMLGAPSAAGRRSVEEMLQDAATAKTAKSARKVQTVS